MRWSPELLEEVAGLSHSQAAEAVSSKTGAYVSEDAVRRARVRAAAASKFAPPSTRPVAPAAPAAKRTDVPVAPERQNVAAAEQGRGFSRIAVISDIHVPDHHPAAIEAFIEWAKDVGVDEIIVLGDFFEFESASEHPASRPIDHESDMQAGLALARRFLEIAPTTVRQGNHDTRPERIIANRAPTMSGCYDPMEALADIGVKVVYESMDPMRRGTVKLLHGHEWLPKKTKMASKLHTEKAILKYMEAGHDIVYGHVHVRQLFVHKMHGGNCVARSLGCMRTLQPGWLGTEVGGWELGFCELILRPGSRTIVNSIDATDGRIFYGGRWYGRP